MHATLQPDGRSPKQVNNSPKSTSQLKPASDSGQNSGTFPSQAKGKKRERVDNGSDYVKRGRSSRTDGGDLLHHKSEYNLKSEIARITENGGLVDLEGVDKLVQLMQPDRTERKMELVSRSMLVGVMAATDKVDCLNRFVQLRGLQILDGWLQDIHKGKIGEGNSSKDNDKFVEELLLVSLRALDKLPVNLHALQMCNIGRSVNHLRSHKNLEIQRNARSLVDTWKKRVEAEMISIDAKSRQPETSHGGSRTTPSGSDVAVKSSISENSAIKTTSVRSSSHGENNNMKSATSSPGPGKSSSSGAPDKDSQPLIKEDRSSSSNSQSHNRKSSGFPISNTGDQKETSSVRSSSAHRTTSLDKFSQSCERVLEGGAINEGSVYKLIVKIPNRVHSPSPAPSQDKSDVNVGSLQNCESKNVLTTEDSRRSVDASPSNQWNEHRKLNASSFSPMNALVESCAKYSEAANSSMTLEDDVGMNLLASVAAGEISISNMMFSHAGSTERRTPAVEVVCNGHETKSKCTPEDISGGKICNPRNTSKYISGGEHDSRFGSSNRSFGKETATATETSDNKSSDKSIPLVLPISGENVRDGKSNDVCNVGRDRIVNCKSDGFCVTIPKEKTNSDLLNGKDKLTPEVSASRQSSDGDFQSELNEELNMGTSSPPKLSSEKLQPTAGGQFEGGDGVNVGEPDQKDHLKGCTNKYDGVNTDTKLNSDAACDSQCKEDCSSTSDEIKSYHKVESVKDEEIPEDSSVPRKGSPGSVCIEAVVKAELRGPGSTSNRPDESSSSAAEASDLDSKVQFDLNEGFSDDEDKYGDSLNPLSSVPTTVHSASITVAAAAKGPFVPPEHLLRGKAEIGWKGSAATSAFRPAEPRKTSPDASTSKHGRVLLDFDLNVPDERVLEEMAYRESTNDTVTNCATSLNGTPSSVPLRSSGWLDFDLNTVDEANDVGQCSTSSNHKGEGSTVHVKPLGPIMPTVDARRGFDLNNGPGVDDNSIQQFQIIQQMSSPGIPLPPHLSSATSLRMNSPGFGNLSSWFLPGSTYSTVAIPSVLPADRGGEQQRFPVFPSGGPPRPFVGGPPSSGVNPYIPDVYRGSVLSSSPAMPLQPSPFQFSVFPFGNTFPLPSATFPVGATSSYTDSATGPRLFAPQVNPQFQGAVSSQFQRPFIVNLLPDNRSNDGLGSGRMWGRQGLDLNSGPGTMESEVREEMLPGQHSVAGSQALAEEHASRMYSVSGATLKRKDPDGSRENDNFRYKQSPWQ